MLIWKQCGKPWLVILNGDGIHGFEVKSAVCVRVRYLMLLLKSDMERAISDHQLKAVKPSFKRWTLTSPASHLFPKQQEAKFRLHKVHLGFGY